MDRRHFLKAIGAGSLGLAAVPALDGFRTAPAEAATGDWSFYFACSSEAGNGQRATVSGGGVFTASRVWGNGLFAGALGGGSWVARRVVSWRLVGTPGVIAASTVELDVELAREIPSPAVIPARLTVNCNTGGLNTGLPEGFFLAVPGTPYAADGAAGPFAPRDPEVGITHISAGYEFGGFDVAWRQEFQRLHGRPPDANDRADRIWSLEFAARNGRPPNDAEWLARWRSNQ